MQSVNVSLPSSTGVKLAATIDFPSTRPKAFAIFAHCFAGSRHTPGASRVSKRLTDYGIATLRFDFPGLGQSEGKFQDTSFSQNVADIKAAYAWLEENYQAPQLIMGHSLGGAATLKAATELKGLKAVATIGAPFDPAHSVLHYADKISEVDANGEVTVTLGGRELVISRGFLEDLAETNPEAYLPRLRKPLLLVHSPIDQTVGVDNAQTIFSLTRYPKSLVALDKADHLLTRQGTAQRAADIIGDWVQFYLRDESAVETPEKDHVFSHSARGLRYGDVVSTTFGEIQTDRTKRDGGKDQGHSAADLLMAAVAVTASQAIRKAGSKMDLDDVRVDVRQVDSTTFERRIELIGDLSAEEKESLLAVAKSSDVDGLFSGITVQDR
ncbi:bifunctional alpha/beta hydrolase/OsmC family protein [Corynebacterium tapiri]|uniref:Alpha/beta fold hydrolase n=1 Tax=Corynebacterium tapiri TaxID=1448266 RepID=A0A5C4U562_9CORY|nr:alpha/beta fold hydrolase [Corynebacterium tapiri]TNL97643.1 alpha/beta fold hydrolase [Corynebacterium tapiri]